MDVKYVEKIAEPQKVIKHVFIQYMYRGKIIF